MMFSIMVEVKDSADNVGWEPVQDFDGSLDECRVLLAQKVRETGINHRAEFLAMDGEGVTIVEPALE